MRFLQDYGFLNQFSLADMFVGLAMLASLGGLGRDRPWGAFLNAIAGGAFLAIFSSASSYFVLVLKQQTPRAAPYLTGLGLVVALSCLVLHLRAARS